MEPMPPVVFDIEAFFNYAYPRRTGDEDYIEQRKMYMDAECTVFDNGSVMIRFKPQGSTIIPAVYAKRFLSRGPWDRHDFTDNERILAWRLECLRASVKNVV